MVNGINSGSPVLQIDQQILERWNLLTSMRLGTDRIREIVLSLRNFSRLDESALKTVDLHQGIDSTLMTIQHRLNATNKRPEIDIIKDYGELPLVECYASSFNQVLLYLLSNAIDAIEENWLTLDPITRQFHQNSIRIQTETYPQENGRKWVRIHIEDNGSGIAEEKLGKIFEPFYTTKPVGQGIGIGLSISHQIITEQHHGELSCTSCIGSGTTFFVEIPIVHTRQ
jgi:two-component system, NtrC family, sensor kinase